MADTDPATPKPKSTDGAAKPDAAKPPPSRPIAGRDAPASRRRPRRSAPPAPVMAPDGRAGRRDAAAGRAALDDRPGRRPRPQPPAPISITQGGAADVRRGVRLGHPGRPAERRPPSTSTSSQGGIAPCQGRPTSPSSRAASCWPAASASRSSSAALGVGARRRGRSPRARARTVARPRGARRAGADRDRDRRTGAVRPQRPACWSSSPARRGRRQDAARLARRLALGAAFGRGAGACCAAADRARRDGRTPGRRTIGGPSATLVGPIDRCQEPTPTVIDPSARVHATADLEPDVTVGAGHEHLAPGPGPDRRTHRRRLRRRPRRLHRRGRRRSATGSRSRTARSIYHGVTVEDGVFIGPGAILTNDRYPRGDHLDRRPRPCRRLDGHARSPSRDGCSIGAGAVVVAGVDVGPFAMVGAGAVVTRSVADYALVVGNPARRIGWVCACGARLADATGHAAPADAERYAARPRAALPGAAVAATPTSPMPSRSREQTAAVVPQGAPA